MQYSLTRRECTVQTVRKYRDPRDKDANIYLKAKQINKIIEDTKVFRKIFKMTEEDSVCNNIKIISLGKNPCRIGKA